MPYMKVADASPLKSYLALLSAADSVEEDRSDLQIALMVSAERGAEDDIDLAGMSHGEEVLGSLVDAYHHRAARLAAEYAAASVALLFDAGILDEDDDLADAAGSFVFTWPEVGICSCILDDDVVDAVAECFGMRVRARALISGDPCILAPDPAEVVDEARVAPTHLVPEDFYGLAG